MALASRLVLCNRRVSLAAVVSLQNKLCEPIRRAQSTTSNRNVGFIGLGNMGLPMARNLADNYTVYGHDNNTSVMDQLKSQDSSIKAAKVHTDMINDFGCGTIITMLPKDDIVNKVMDDLLQVAKDGQDLLVIDCSTVSPATSKYWSAKWRERDCTFIDAPVSGGIYGARDKTLTFMVGCDDKQGIARAQPILESMGKRVLECGTSGTGAACKLCNNLALAAQMIGVCEATNLGESLGVDPLILADVMNVSTSNSWSTNTCNPHPTVAAKTNAPASRDYEGGFGTKLMLKDVELATLAASQYGVALPMGNLAKELYRIADIRGYGSKDFGIMLQVLKGK